MIVVREDFNIDVNKGCTKQWRDELLLKDEILERVGEENAPRTYD